MKNKLFLYITSIILFTFIVQSESQIKPEFYSSFTKIHEDSSRKFYIVNFSSPIDLVFGNKHKIISIKYACPNGCKNAKFLRIDRLVLNSSIVELQFDLKECNILYDENGNIFYTILDGKKYGFKNEEYIGSPKIKTYLKCNKCGEIYEESQLKGNTDTLNYKLRGIR